MRVLLLVAWICAPPLPTPTAQRPYREKDYHVEHYEAELAPYTVAGLKGGVTSQDLERAMEVASGQDLKTLFDACVYGAAPPE